MAEVIFQAPSNFSKAPFVKLALHEKILCVQRLHWFILLERMFFTGLVLLAVVFLLLFLSSQSYFTGIPHLFEIQIFVILIIVVAALLLATFLFMDWYYQFYIITTRCLLHMHFFRTGGYYFDEVFLDQINQQEISRRASNFLYDLLGLFDVAIYFNRLERAEPFIFHAPSDSAAIEDILETLTVRDIERKEEKK